MIGTPDYVLTVGVKMPHYLPLQEVSRLDEAAARSRQAEAAALAAAEKAAKQLEEAVGLRASLVKVEAALEAREAKLHESWKALHAQATAAHGPSSSNPTQDFLLQVIYHKSPCDKEWNLLKSKKCLPMQGCMM